MGWVSAFYGSFWVVFPVSCIKKWLSSFLPCEVALFHFFSCKVAEGFLKRWGWAHLWLAMQVRESPLFSFSRLLFLFKAESFLPFLMTQEIWLFLKRRKLPLPFFSWQPMFLSFSFLLGFFPFSFANQGQLPHYTSRSKLAFGSCRARMRGYSMISNQEKKLFFFVYIAKLWLQTKTKIQLQPDETTNEFSKKRKAP